MPRRLAPLPVADRLRQIAQGEHAALGDINRALDDVFQLAHIARPGIRFQCGQRLRLNAQRPVKPIAQLFEHGAQQQLHVTGAPAQRRHFDREDVEPEEEIGAEVAESHLVRQILVRGGDDTHVHRNHVLATHPHDAARLDGSQQARLQIARHVADLVQE